MAIASQHYGAVPPSLPHQGLQQHMRLMTATNRKRWLCTKFADVVR